MVAARGTTRQAKHEPRGARGVPLVLYPRPCGARRVASEARALFGSSAHGVGSARRVPQTAQVGLKVGARVPHVSAQWAYHRVNVARPDHAKQMMEAANTAWIGVACRTRTR